MILIHLGLAQSWFSDMDSGKLHGRIRSALGLPGVVAYMRVAYKILGFIDIKI